ncbi:baseplate wedge protein [Yersinia phage PYps23T]|uniref:Baseplate wedge protein n=1 Tax=Yersinia phage PYps23T TaxID=2801356 RepID=A0AAE7PH03_9CAUD|nr:baseplate wedge protein [Yersinia phage PYps23T]QQO90991.1 baseplate wedge protein [Yersinia phage PYps23T]
MATIQYGVTENGFVQKPVQEIVSHINSRFLSVFGANFDISPEGPDGQVIGIISEEISKCWQQAEMVFNAYRPGAMQKIGLDNICELTFTKRLVDWPSRVGVRCAGQSGTLVPAGSIVSDGAMDFETQYDCVIPGTVTAVATETGEYYIAANTVNKIITPVAGWESVNNPEIGQTGVDYESDPALRTRRDRTTAHSGSAFVEAIYAALADLNLSYLRIRDNDTGAPIGTQPSGTVFVVVEGGTEDEIARRIYSTKTGGVPTHGTTSVSIYDSKGYPHEVKFSRPEDATIYVSGTFKRRPGSNISSNDAARQLQTAMMDYINSLNPGDSVIWSECFKPIMDATNGVQVDSLFIGTSASPTGIATIELDIDKKAEATTASVIFTETP